MLYVLNLVTNANESASVAFLPPPPHPPPPKILSLHLLTIIYILVKKNATTISRNTFAVIHTFTIYVHTTYLQKL